jgi:hypothetical protein
MHGLVFFSICGVPVNAFLTLARPADCEYFHVVFYITTVSLTFLGNFVPEKPDNNLKAFPNQHKS